MKFASFYSEILWRNIFFKSCISPVISIFLVISFSHLVADWWVLIFFFLANFLLYWPQTFYQLKLIYYKLLLIISIARNNPIIILTIVYLTHLSNLKVNLIFLNKNIHNNWFNSKIHSNYSKFYNRQRKYRRFNHNKWIHLINPINSTPWTDFCQFYLCLRCTSIRWTVASFLLQNKFKHITFQE